MKVTLKLNCKSVWSTCWRIIEIQSRRDFISAADKMNGDISPLGDLWFFFPTVVGTRRQCVCSYSVWLSFLSLSLSLSVCNASPRISIRLLGERVSRMLPREEAHKEKESKDGREKGGCVRYISVLKHRYVGVEWEVIYAPSHAESSFTPPLFAGAGRLIGPLAVLIKDHWQIPIDRFTMIATLNSPSCTCYRKSCPDAMCVKWITGRKTLMIRLKNNKKKKPEREIIIYIWAATENNHSFLLSPSNHTGQPQEDDRLSQHLEVFIYLLLFLSAPRRWWTSKRV